jgi:uncharacterized repeat protein (TIGR01451 family)
MWWPGWQTALIFAQVSSGWQQIPGFGSYDFARGFLPTPDGGFIAAGHSGNGPDLHDGFLVKTDPFGSEQWRKTFGGNSHDEINDLRQTSDGGYILTGNTFSFGNGSADVWLIKTDRLGNLQWQQALGTAALEFGRAVIETSDGGYAVVGRSDNGADIGILLIKTDALGNEQWSNIYGGAGEDESWGLTETPDNQLVFAGTTASFGAGDKDVYLGKVALDGTFSWFQTFGGADDDLGYTVIPTSDGGLLVGGATRSFGVGDYDVYVIKTTADGSEQGSKTYGGAFGEWGAYLLEMPGGGFAIAGSAQSFNNLLDDVYLVRTDALGNELWFRTYGKARKDIPHSLALAPDGGFLIAGHSRIDNANGSVLTSAAYLLRTDSQGYILSNRLQGAIFWDADNDCQQDPGETGFGGWILRATAGNKQFFGLTEADGSYSILTDSGSYVLSLFPPNAYWQPCENDVSLSFSGLNDTLVADFPLQAAIICPQLEVDVATSVVRPCSTGVFQVRYCNHGTATANGAYAELKLDAFQQLISSGLPIAGQAGNTYRFDLGDVAAGDCGGFPLEIQLACGAETGRTHCVTAHIFPDSICLPPNPAWSGARIEVSGVCMGDSVLFTLKNTGTGSTTGPMKSIIIEDQIIGRAVEFQLQPGESIQLMHPANGKTIRLEAEQAPGHPGKSKPSVTVEGCSNGGNISKGFVTMFPEDDADAFRSIDCRENAAYFPPNAKLAFPKGIDNQHLLRPGADVEYLIRFQNTGEDTLAAVVIQDTLSPWLDLTTLRPGTASHPYRLSVSNTGVLQFTLDNLALPDSATNEAASHGFVKFRVSQQPGIPFDSLVINRSCISFDYELPVAKPLYTHTLAKPQAFSISDVSLCTGGVFQGVAVTSDTTFLTYAPLPALDSFAFTNVFVLPTYSLDYQDTICAGDLYFFNGEWVTAPGIYTDSLATVTGCDSLVTLHLEALPLAAFEFSDSFCVEEPYFFNGEWLSAPGTYQDTLFDSNDCDSLITLHLALLPNFQVSLDTAVAVGSTFLGIPVYSDTVLVQTISAKEECDSLLTWVVDVFTKTSEWSAETTGFHIFPNPSADAFMLEFTLSSPSFIDVKIIDLFGRPVNFPLQGNYFGEGKNILKIDAEKWTSGLYLLGVQIGDNWFFKNIIKTP